MGKYKISSLNHKQLSRETNAFGSF